jgi:hypothetical protein
MLPILCKKITQKVLKSFYPIEEDEMRTKEEELQDLEPMISLQKENIWFSGNSDLDLDLLSHFL